MTFYEHQGFCPICQRAALFKAEQAWLRDWLLCEHCHSIPRERALALILDELRPTWRNLSIHESSPTPRGISTKLKREGRFYLETQFFPGRPLGQLHNGVRNEDLEALTFSDRSFDIFVSLDVMEHVNMPEKVFKEAVRTLRPGGLCIFTTPTYKALNTTVRRARYLPGGGTDFMGNAPEYHGNPVSDAGALVTFHFGYDLPDLIREWSDLDTRVYRFQDRRHGIVGEFTEVYACTKTET